MAFLAILCLWAYDLTRACQAQPAPLAVPPPPGLVETANQQHVSGELFVKFRGGPLGNNATSINQLLGSEVIRSFARVGWQLVRLRSNLPVEAAIQRYLKFEAVLAAEPNGYLRMTDSQSVIPDDPDFPEQWGATAIGAPGAWAISTGDPDIVIAVIDSGVDYSHEDLSANMWRNPGESGIDDQGNDKATNGLDDDANGYVDDVFGIDPGNQDSDPMDEFGHGTAVAGIIGAVGDNGRGIAGLNWNTQMMALRIFGNNVTAVSAAIEAYEYILEMKHRGINIRVTNNSYGGGSFAQQVFKEAIDAAGALDILNVFAAGNRGADTDIEPDYPSSFDSPSLLVVTSTKLDPDTGEESLDTAQNWGVETVDLAAPGMSIYSTSLSPDAPYGGGYSGTSFAAPYVAGAIALLASIDPSLSASEIQRALILSVDPIPSLRGRVLSGGRLAIDRSARAIDPSSPSIVLLTLPTGSGTSVEPMARIVFSKSMNRESVQAGFAVTQELPGSFEWSDVDRVMTFRPESSWWFSGELGFRLSGEAWDLQGKTLDGNENRLTEGSPIDDVTWSFMFLPPVVNAFSPKSAKVGAIVVIRGSRFSEVNRIRLGGTEAEFRHHHINKDGLLYATVPAGAKTGLIEVESPAGVFITTEALVVEESSLPPIAVELRNGSELTLVWPASIDAILEACTELASPEWNIVNDVPVENNGLKQLPIEIGPDNRRFYRLRYP